MTTVAEVATRAIDAMERLGAVGQTIEDEWQYVSDLGTVYRGRLSQVAASRAADPVTPVQDAAITMAIEEAALIDDPHRAIDWLSTLPQVVLYTLGETA